MWKKDALYDVMLHSYGENKIACIRVLREVIPNFGLKEALDFVQGPMPATVLTGVLERVSRTGRDKLVAVGATAKTRRTKQDSQ